MATKGNSSSFTVLQGWPFCGFQKLLGICVECPAKGFEQALGDERNITTGGVARIDWFLPLLPFVTRKRCDMPSTGYYSLCRHTSASAAIKGFIFYF